MHSGCIRGCILYCAGKDHVVFQDAIQSGTLNTLKTSKNSIKIESVLTILQAFFCLTTSSWHKGRLSTVCKFVASGQETHQICKSFVFLNAHFKFKMVVAIYFRSRVNIVLLYIYPCDQLLSKRQVIRRQYKNLKDLGIQEIYTDTMQHTYHIIIFEQES